MLVHTAQLYFLEILKYKTLLYLIKLSIVSVHFLPLNDMQLVLYLNILAEAWT